MPTLRRAQLPAPRGGLGGTSRARPPHTVVVDLAFGDSGKGSVVDYLCSPAGPARRAGGDGVAGVVRFNGGAQAAHNVVLPDGREHTFAQFGSGSFHGVPTLLSDFMLVEPLALAAEAAALAAAGVPHPLDLLSIDPAALVTTPWHAWVNRAREVARGSSAHGSCGIGVGETAAYALDHPDDAVRVRDGLSGDGGTALRRRLCRLADWARATSQRLGVPAVSDSDGSSDLGAAPDVESYAQVLETFARRVRLVDSASWLRAAAARGQVVFEAAQGILLDEWVGFHPHTTWSTTTAANALDLLARAGIDPADADNVLRLGVTRTYTTRHGAGPLVTHDPALDALLPERHNGTGRWQGAFRLGHLDLVALRYAVEAGGGVDALAVTHLDATTGVRVARQWIADGRRVERLPVSPTPRDLDYQERLTMLARASRPVLSDVDGPFAGLIGEDLGLPVALTSSGPTWPDKAIHLAGRARSGMRSR